VRVCVCVTYVLILNLEEKAKFSNNFNGELNFFLFADTNDKDTLQVQPLQTELQNDTTESKSTTKKVNVKTTTEIKKKPIMVLKEAKGEQSPIDEYYWMKSIKDDDSRRPVNPDVPMTSSISPTTISMRMNQSSVTTKIGDAVTIPFLLHGAPTAAVTKATPTSGVRDTSNSTVKVIDEIASSRGRALNISAPEPTNSLHANISDLSMVSMDEDDQEVEGEHCLRERQRQMADVFFIINIS